VGQLVRGNGTFDLGRGPGASYAFVVTISDFGADVVEADRASLLRE
jgi:hypothetical protein